MSEKAPRPENKEKPNKSETKPTGRTDTIKKLGGAAIKASGR